MINALLQYGPMISLEGALQYYISGFIRVQTGTTETRNLIISLFYFSRAENTSSEEAYSNLSFCTSGPPIIIMLKMTISRSLAPSSGHFRSLNSGFTLDSDTEQGKVLVQF